MKILTLIATVALSLVFSVSALAAKPSNSSIQLNESNPAAGDTITFTVSTDVDGPFVHLQCFQNGELVQEGWDAFNYDFNLATSPAWQIGAAVCTATLEDWTSYGRNGKTKDLASVSFNVSE